MSSLAFAARRTDRLRAEFERVIGARRSVLAHGARGGMVAVGSNAVARQTFLAWVRNGWLVQGSRVGVATRYQRGELAQ